MNLLLHRGFPVSLGPSVVGQWHVGSGVSTSGVADGVADGVAVLGLVVGTGWWHRVCEAVARGGGTGAVARGRWHGGGGTGAVARRRWHVHSGGMLSYAICGTSGLAV
jgi:hypothetical protein